MNKPNFTKGCKVVVRSSGKSNGRVGTYLKFFGTRPHLLTSCSVRLDATSDKPACNIVIKHGNVEKL